MPALLCLALLVLAPPPPAGAQADHPPAEGAAAERARLPTIAAIALSIKSRAIQDSRCYLMNGGAVESFFISEDTPVGSVIGTLSVNGDANEETGNISLTLQEKDAAVGIAAGTKNLTLLRALDREEKRGPSNVYVNVRCDRRGTTDPSFVVPVSVRVWDVNDNAPQWAGAPYRVRVSELAAAGSRVLAAARAADADQPGPHATVRYSVLPGPHSEYFGFANELDSVLVIKKPLDYETLSNFTVTLRAQDQGRPPLHSDALLHVEVLDADDQNPKFTHDHYTALLPDDAQEGTILQTSPGPVSARDQDTGINAPLYYTASGDRGNVIHMDRDTGRIAATRRLLESEDMPVTVVIKATQVDNEDRYALATLTVSRGARGAGAGGARGAGGGGARGAGGGGARGAAGAGVRFSRRVFAAAAREDTPPGTVLTTLHTEPKPSAQHALQFFVSERSFLERFAISGAGELLLRRALDREAAAAYAYQVMVTDGLTNDTASINITVLDVNEWEPRFKYPQYEFRVDGEGSDGGALLPVGRLEVHDGDADDAVHITLRGADAHMFYMNSSGDMFLRQEALAALNASVLHVLATAVDSGQPPRQTSVPVVVHVGGRLRARGGGGGGAGGGGAGGLRGASVLALFAAALALLAILVLVLLMYIYRRRRSKSTPATVTNKQGGFVSHEKPSSAGGAGVGGGAGAGVGAGVGAGGGSGSLLSVSAGASTILADSSSSLDLRADASHAAAAAAAARNATVGRQSQRFPGKSKVAPAPPVLDRGSAGVGGGVGVGTSAGVGVGAGAGAEALMSDHLGARHAGRSGVAWPSATIPARVKKLSWDDATDHQDSGEGAREVLDATNPTLADHMNLTVYF